MSDDEMRGIKPESKKAKIDTSSWPLLLKVTLYF